MAEVVEPQVSRYPAYKPTGVEWMPEIPVGWEVKKLKYFASVETGGTPPKSDDSNYADDGIPWIKPDNLDGFTPIKESKERLSIAGIAFARIIPKGSVLICGIGSIGKLGVAGCDLTTNQQINSVIFGKKVAPEFGKYLLQAGQEEMQKKSSKVVVAILTKSALLDLIFPYPPSLSKRPSPASWTTKPPGSTSSSPRSSRCWRCCGRSGPPSSTTPLPRG